MTQGNGQRGPVDISASQWRQIVDSATETAIISTDIDGRVTSWSRGAQRMLGWSEDEMLGRTLECIFTSDEREQGRLAQEFADARDHGRGGGEEGWRRRKDGGCFWAAGEITPIRAESGTITGYVKIVRNRTRQRDAEDALREERRALELLNRAASALAIETDLKNLLQIVTDAGVALSGAEFGAFFYNVVEPSGESYMLYTLSGAPIEAFSRFPMPRKTQIFGPTFAGQSIVRSGDVTRDPRYGHNAPYHGMPEGHLPVRSYLAVPVIARSGEVLGGLFFGHTRTGMFDERSEHRLAALAAEAAVAVDNARLADSTQREIVERKRAEEALRELNATLEQQVAERGEQLRRSEEALRQSQKLEAVGQLTGGVAHDFNNLLQIIVGNLEILHRSLPAESGRLQRAVSHAMTGARRAASLTQRLLAFARRQPLDPKPIDVNTLVSNMSDMLHRSLGETIAVETVHGAGLWPIEADPGELEAAMLNIAVNARDAMPRGGRLTIETANTHLDERYAAMNAEVLCGQYVLISMSDTGTGMSAQTVQRAFEPFFTTKPVGHGTGLGLSQVYGFVKQSGGHVRIYSEQGQGTTVKLYLPRLVRGYTAPGEDEPDPLPGGGNEETILVVEDDEQVRTFSVDALRELGYRVVEAADGPTALRILAREPRIDLIFTDVVLPGGMTGADVAAGGRDLRPGIKVLFTTGYARNAIIHQGRLDKGVNLITKPFSLAGLAEKVRDALDATA